jgi:hypothetical protein
MFLVSRAPCPVTASSTSCGMACGTVSSAPTTSTAWTETDSSGITPAGWRTLASSCPRPYRHRQPHRRLWEDLRSRQTPRGLGLAAEQALDLLPDHNQRGTLPEQLTEKGGSRRSGYPDRRLSKSGEPRRVSATTRRRTVVQPRGFPGDRSGIAFALPGVHLSGENGVGLNARGEGGKRDEGLRANNGSNARLPRAGAYRRPRLGCRPSRRRPGDGCPERRFGNLSPLQADAGRRHRPWGGRPMTRGVPACR